MLNLLWSILNVVVSLGIGYLFFRAARLVQQRMGVSAALLFVCGLLIVGCGKTSNPVTSPKNLLVNIPANAPLGNASATRHITLGGSNTLFLLAEYRVSDGIIVPRGLFATVSGIMLGHRWEPMTGTLEQKGAQVHSLAVLNHQWLLLGTPVFTSSSEIFEGLMTAAAPR